MTQVEKPIGDFGLQTEKGGINFKNPGNRIQDSVTIEIRNLTLPYSCKITVSNLRETLSQTNLERDFPSFLGLNRVLPSVMPAQAGPVPSVVQGGYPVLRDTPGFPLSPE